MLSVSKSSSCQVPSRSMLDEIFLFSRRRCSAVPHDELVGLALVPVDVHPHHGFLGDTRALSGPEDIESLELGGVLLFVERVDRTHKLFFPKPVAASEKYPP